MILFGLSLGLSVGRNHELKSIRESYIILYNDLLTNDSTDPYHPAGDLAASTPAAWTRLEQYYIKLISYHILIDIKK